MESYKLCQVCRAIDFKSLVYEFNASGYFENDSQEELRNAGPSFENLFPNLSTNDATSSSGSSNVTIPCRERVDRLSSTQVIPRKRSYTTMLEGDGFFRSSGSESCLSGDSSDSSDSTPWSQAFSVEFNSDKDNSSSHSFGSLRSVASSTSLDNSLPDLSSEGYEWTGDEFFESAIGIENAEDSPSHNNSMEISLTTLNFIADHLDGFASPENDSNTKDAKNNVVDTPSPGVNSSSPDIFELGYLDDIEQRSSECAFCQLIAESAKEMIAKLPKREGASLILKGYPRLTCSLQRDRLCTVHKWHNNSYGGFDVNRLILLLGPSTGPFGALGYSDVKLRLQPCYFPIPLIEDYWKSKPFGEEMGDVKSSGRLINSYADARLFRKWLLQCEMTHGRECSHPKWLGEMGQIKGLKVIDVESMCVVDVDALPSCRFLALSYVWGEVICRQESQTTTKNIAQRRNKNGLNEELLPQTIKDAIFLVKEMKERYLWVDAICINQDDELEKATFIQHMDIIFSAALLTIIAAGKDANNGLVGLRPQSRAVVQSFARVGNDLALMRTARGDKSYTFRYSRWNQRGWTYQERYVSRRTLIFTNIQVHWQCQVEEWNEETVLEPSKPRTSLVS
jgi:hypothetical protein